MSQFYITKLHPTKVASLGTVSTRHSAPCMSFDVPLVLAVPAELSQREYLMGQPSGSPLHGPPPAAPTATAAAPAPSNSRRRQAAPAGQRPIVTQTAAGGATVPTGQEHCVVRKPGRPDAYIPVRSGVRVRILNRKPAAHTIMNLSQVSILTLASTGG